MHKNPPSASPYEAIMLTAPQLLPLLRFTISINVQSCSRDKKENVISKNDTNKIINNAIKIPKNTNIDPTK